MPVTHNTFILTRTYPTTPARVFAALSDPAKKRIWFAESDSYEVERFETNFEVGAKEQGLFRLNKSSPFPGVLITNDALYLDIVTNQRIVQAYSMTMGDKRISASLVTFEVNPNGTATDLILTHQGVFFEHSDGPEMRQSGWRKLLGKLEAQCQPEK